MSEERMTELEKLCEQALYEEVQLLEDGRSIVRDNASGRLYYRKRLSFYNPDVFAWLKVHKSRYVPRIETFWQDGEDLIVIEELIQGKTLEEVLEESEKGEDLSFQERIRILTELCDGLTFLHSADPPIIHRDLKASNIMLSEDGVVKIIDYDAAKLYVRGQKRDTQLIGTQGTAAPEQYGFGASDARTDIYALGKLLSRMLPDNADAIRIAARATNIDPARRYAAAAQIREPIRRIREKPSGLDRLLENFPGYDPSNRKHRTMARVSIPVLCVVIVLLSFFLYDRCVVVPREQEKALSGALKTLSENAVQPDEIADMSAQLLQQWPYDRMTPGQQEQFRESAKKMIQLCCSSDTGELQESGLRLSEEGTDYLELIGSMGVDEQTVKEISIAGQIRYMMKLNQWENAFGAVKYLKGLPNEEAELENVEQACMDASEKYIQKFQKQPAPVNASAAFKFYSQLMDAGFKDSKVLFDSFYETVLSFADESRDAGKYATADSFYQVLLDYENEAGRDESEKTITERILENDYLNAQSQMDSGNYSEGRKAFLEIGDYKDAAVRADECAYLQAQQFASRENYEKAVDLFAEISGYKDADTKRLEMEYAYCMMVVGEPDDLAYEYIAELIDAGYAGASELREKLYTWHVTIETGMGYLVGAEQAAEIRATLSGGPEGGATYLHFELIDRTYGRTYTWTSEEKCSRGESCSSSYRVSSLTENIFEQEYTVNIYIDDGSQIGSWNGSFSMDFLKD